MPFFIPCQCEVGDPHFDRVQTIFELTDSQYFGSELTNEQQRLEELAIPFKHERELAFFLVNIGISRSDYLSLTDLEKVFIKKSYEDKIISDNTLFRNAVLNAKINAERKKGKRFVELFKKQPRKIDQNIREQTWDLILNIEKKENDHWTDKIYESNGIKFRKEDV